MTAEGAPPDEAAHSADGPTGRSIESATSEENSIDSRRQRALTPSSGDLDSPVREALVVEILGVEFGFDLRDVTEVSDVPPITRLPFANGSIPGVLAIRGAILPVFDLADRLFGRPSDRKGRIIIAPDPRYRSQIAILVERIVDLITFTTMDGAIPPEVVASLPPGWIEGVVSTDENRFVTMLNLPAVLERTGEDSEDDR